MVGFCVVRKLANRVSGMSKRWMSTDTCVIRGERGDILLPGDMFEPLSAHEARFPLITKIPHGEVIKVDPTRPSLINDHWRPILHSGLLHSLMCKSQKDCIVDAFDYSNVGVLKGCDVLAFKKFDRQVGKINIDHKGYSSFIQELFSRLSGVSNLQRQFKECGNLVSGCETGVDDELLRYSTFFLEGEELAVFYSDAQRLLRQELKHRSNGPEAKRILRELGRRFLNKDVIRECSHHRMFKFHLGSHSPWEKKKKLNEGVPVPDFPGTAVVDVHRIAVTHAIEDNLMGNLMKIHPELSELWSNYSRDDVISALRYMFTDYPDKVLEAFYKVELLDQLQMKRRLPTPKIYKYATPVLGNKEDHQGGARNYNY